MLNGLVDYEMGRGVGVYRRVCASVQKMGRGLCVRDGQRGMCVHV